ncbi:MAG: hypothetical protein O2878_05630 [Bacteroidetes bacterium]|nr:hypothetical protein [Bacteroidota bacterium]MDA0936591.1 hypothetical protein [Bacteroidota bacterium]
MFSKGQVLFAVFFIIAFVALMIFSYRGDAKSHNLHYRGSLKIFLVFLLIIFALFLIKFFTQ